VCRRDTSPQNTTTADDVAHHLAGPGGNSNDGLTDERFGLKIAALAHAPAQHPHSESDVSQRSTRTLAVLCIVALTAVSATAAMFVTTTWIGSDVADWGVATNWDTGSVPTAADAVRIFNGGIADVTTSGSAASSVVIGGDSSQLWVTGSGELSTGGIQLVGDSTRVTVHEGGQITRTGGAFEVGSAGSSIAQVSDAGSRIDWTGGTVDVGVGGEGDLFLTGGAEFAADTITLGGNGGTGRVTVGDGGVAGVLSANITAGPQISLDQAGVVFNHSDDITYAGTISGRVVILKVGTGALTLAQPSTYADLNVVEGTVRAGAANVLDPGALVRVQDVLDLNGFSQAIGALEGEGTILLGGATLTTGLDNGDGQFSGTLSGGTLVKAGDGELTLSGPNTHALTEVTGGVLLVNGSQGSSNVAINGGRLGGTGTVGTITATSGTVAPGLSPGILNSGTVDFNAATTFSVELDGLTAGTGYDQLNVTGTVSLGGATLTLLPGFAAPAGAVFTIINNDLGDAVTGTFDGLGEGAGLIADGQTFRISYAGGDGNDVTLEVIAALELGPPTLPDFTAGEPVSVTFTTTGGVAPYTYAVTDGALPDGLTLDEAAGVLSGTPTTAGPFAFEITSEDDLGSVSSAPYSGDVLPAPVPSMPWIALLVLGGILARAGYVRLTSQA
jgi:autotransporter-associated beta strand protein